MSNNASVPPNFTTLPPLPPKPKPPLWTWVVGAALVVVIVLLSVTVGTRNDGTEEAAPVTPPVTATATPTPVGSGIQDRAPVIVPQSQFLNFVRGEAPYLLDVPDDEVMAYSDAVCDALDEGKTPEEVLKDIEKGSNSKAEAYAKGIVAGFTVENYCPKYSKDFEKFLNGQGVAVES